MKNRTDPGNKYRSAQANHPQAGQEVSQTAPLLPVQKKAILGWFIAPLRLFLGITFIYGGIQKLTDPQYFNPWAAGYIGKQIQGFATGSPIHNMLIGIALPHATIFGALVAYGELAIGLGTLLGLLLRPAAFFGLLLNMLFFLSATWRVHPYFYGSDIVFVFCWITLLLAGPLYSGLPSLDGLLAPYLLRLAAPAPGRDKSGTLSGGQVTYAPPRKGKQATIVAVLNVLLGTGKAPFLADQSAVGAINRPLRPIADPMAGKQTPPSRRNVYREQQLAFQREQSRRHFIWGMITGGGAMFVLAWLGESLHLLPGSTDATNRVPTSLPVNNPAGTPSVSGTATATEAIANAHNVPANSAVNFTLPSNGDPGILIHLGNGQFVAYDATCTHAGCPVDYDPGSQHLVCPCHGAEFDPARAAAVLGGPTNTPLTSVPITVDNASGTISIHQ